MRKILLAIAITLTTIIPLPVQAATPGEFHAGLLRRGIAAYEAGRNEEAVKHLRLAAFGFIDSIAQYQTAHTYLALTYDKMKDADRTRDSMRRIVQAERVERRFASIALPPAVRSAVMALAGRLLTATEVELLRTTATGAPAPTPAGPAASTPPVVKPATTTTPRTAGGETPPSQPARTPALPAQQPTTTQTQPVQPPRPQPQQSATTTQPAQSQQPAQTQPATTQTPPRPTPQQPATSNQQPATPNQPLSAAAIANRLAAGERALTASSLTEARRIYRELLAAPGLAHETLIRVAEGFYRARDFQGALAAFERAGTLRRGEEPYRYYIAVALYETGQYERARRELASALPFIEITPDVARYRSKIEGALN
ncbi:MAG TPA: tetratricopeptide repeat protein [Thermoanaerobaculia bacterium]|nr:tetratricopeptide repeat protein [Thermoanaerobaculia bacterium]